MYSYFKGKIQEVLNNSIIIEVNNIGYNIHMAENDISNLSVGNVEIIYTYLQHRDDDMRLYGFLKKENLEFFKKLITVSGVGAKLAVGIISNISAEDMCSAIVTEDLMQLKTIPGIGPKMASKIIFELKDKVSTGEMFKKTIAKPNKEAEEAITALKVLGYSERELNECINNLELENKSVQEIIKTCLGYMRK